MRRKQQKNKSTKKIQKLEESNKQRKAQKKAQKLEESNKK